MTSTPRPSPLGGDGGAERMVVEAIRRELGPRRPPDVDGLETACEFRPAGLELAMFGGDFVEFTSGGGLQQLAVTIGDVAGKGVAAAILALKAKIAARAVVRGLRWPPAPGEALMEIHNALLEGELPTHAFVTMQFGVYNARTGVFSVASAGHPSPVVIRRESIERPLVFVAPAIGVTSEAEIQPFPAEYIELGEGDAVLLYTDGLTEARGAGGAFYEDARLDEALEELRGLPAAELLERLVADVVDFSGGPPADDLALVLLRHCVADG